MRKVVYHRLIEAYPNSQFVDFLTYKFTVTSMSVRWISMPPREGCGYLQRHSQGHYRFCEKLRKSVMQYLLYML